MKFDYEYYRQKYGGVMTENEFSRWGECASDVIASALCEKRIGVGGECGDDAVLRALCSEADYIAAGGLESHRGILKEALGDWSVTYGSAAVSLLSPAALAALKAGGLMGRWV